MKGEPRSDFPRGSLPPLDRAAFLHLVTAPDLTPLALVIEAGRFDALLPGLRAELDFVQRTRWHALTVLRHSAATAELLPANAEIRVTGFLHDLGKRSCAATNIRGEDSYIGHAAAGARLAEPYLVALGFDAAARERMRRRIAAHMDLHSAGRDAVSVKSLDKVLDRLGPDLGFLSDLAVADTATMSPTIAAAKLAEHRALQERLRVRARERGLPAWTITTAAVGPHPAAAAAIRAGSAHVPVVRSEAEMTAARALADQTLIAALHLMPAARTARPRLLLTCGLPVSGKSYLARSLTARVPSLARLSSDTIRMHLTRNAPTYSGPESAMVHGTIARLAGQLLADGRSVVIDATGVRPRDRRAALEAAGGRPTLIAWCEVDETTAAARLAARAARADPLDHSEANADVRARMASLTTPPRSGEAGLILVVTPANFATALNRLAAALA